jgi:hypothetical protein
LQGGSEDAGLHAIRERGCDAVSVVKNFCGLHVCGYDTRAAADGLAGEDLAEIDLLPVEADATAGRDNDSLVREGMVEVRQVSIRPW